MKIFPISLRFYGADRPRGRAVFGSNLFVWSRVVEYLKCGLLVEDRPIALFSVTLPSVADGIGVIFFGRPPAKIIYFIIPRVAVAMKANLAFCWRAFKGTQNKLVRGKHFPLSVLPQLKKWSAGCSAARLRQDSNRSHISQVRDLVKALVANCWSPDFHPQRIAHKGIPCPC